MFFLLSVVTPIEVICPNVLAKPLPSMRKVHFRLTYVFQNRLSLNSQMTYIKPSGPPLHIVFSAHKNKKQCLVALTLLLRGKKRLCQYDLELLF